MILSFSLEQVFLCFLLNISSVAFSIASASLFLSSFLYSLSCSLQTSFCLASRHQISSFFFAFLFTFHLFFRDFCYVFFLDVFFLSSLLTSFLVFSWPFLLSSFLTCFLLSSCLLRQGNKKACPVLPCSCCCSGLFC